MPSVGRRWAQHLSSQPLSLWEYCSFCLIGSGHVNRPWESPPLLLWWDKWLYKHPLWMTYEPSSSLGRRSCTACLLCWIRSIFPCMVEYTQLGSSISYAWQHSHWAGNIWGMYFCSKIEMYNVRALTVKKQATGQNNAVNTASGSTWVHWLMMTSQTWSMAMFFHRKLRGCKE